MPIVEAAGILTEEASHSRLLRLLHFQAAVLFQAVEEIDDADAKESRHAGPDGLENEW